MTVQNVQSTENKYKNQRLSRTENQFQVLSRSLNRTPEIQGFSRRV